MHILVTEIYVKQKNVLLYINLYIAHRWLNLGQIDSFFFLLNLLRQNIPQVIFTVEPARLGKWKTCVSLSHWQFSETERQDYKMQGALQTNVAFSNNLHLFDVLSVTTNVKFKVLLYLSLHRGSKFEPVFQEASLHVLRSILTLTPQMIRLPLSSI